MISYKTYNFVAAVCLIAVSGFTSILIFGSDPQDANAVSTEGPALGAPTVTPILTDNLAVSPAEYSEVQGELPEMIPFEGMEPLVQDLPEGATPIEITSDDSGNSAHFASEVEIDNRSNIGAVASNYSGSSSGSGSSSSGGGSGSYDGGNTTGRSSGMGGSSSHSGSGAGGGSGGRTVIGAGSGTGTGGSRDTGPGTGGSVFPDPDPDSDPGTGTQDDTTDDSSGGGSPIQQIDPDDLLCLGLQRNRTHFRLIDDPHLGYLFAPNFVWDIRVFTNQDELFRMTTAMRKQNPNTVLGSYSSSCLTVPASKDTYPPAKLPSEQCRPEWLLRDADGKAVPFPGFAETSFLDMRQPVVRQAIIGLALARAIYNGLDVVCFDNCYWGIKPTATFPVSATEWSDAYMQFYREAGQAAHDVELQCVVNVATNADKIADAFRAIAPHVDGLMSEMAFHPNMRNPNDVARELAGYEDVLKLGKFVALVPRYSTDEKFALTAIRSLALQYHNIYVTAAGDVHHEPLYYLPQPDQQE